MRFNLKNHIANIIESQLILVGKNDEFTIKQLYELCLHLQDPGKYLGLTPKMDYDKLQNYLQSANEKGSLRKKQGVYYTPKDVVDFIVITALKLDFSYIKNSVLTNTIDSIRKNEILTFCFEKTFFEPTCGTGEFLLSVLDIKIKLLSGIKVVDSEDLQKILMTLHGNDINTESISIAKLRIWLYVKHYLYTSVPINIVDILNSNFKEYDFVNSVSVAKNERYKYDYVLGNPPYVEDSKSGLSIDEKYGNIYANILINTLMLLKENGVMGFIIPISFVSTPRMKKLRTGLLKQLDKLFILSYSDRPDCLFVGVHQKLCIIIGRKSNDTKNQTIHTSNYQYWYKSERESLFSTTEIATNYFDDQGFIPKLGTNYDERIYQKILSHHNSLFDYLTKRGKDSSLYSVSLNIRATFWVKAFLKEHLGGEYKQFKFLDKESSEFAMCLLNSSLFWWFWVVVSDCWHITQKELKNFFIPDLAQIDMETFSILAQNLEVRLANTKQYVGTKQVDYEYKHKLCLEEIHQIDDAIGLLYDLELDEVTYIKNFALKYRTGLDVTTSN